MSEEKYADYIEAILKECPDAKASDVADAFAKYEEEFYIPPQDAMRSVLRRFKSGTAPASIASSDKAPKQTQKIARLSELSGNERDIEIEVAIITHNLRDQTIRGEEKKIAFGMLEDLPWDENGVKTRWDYKDWGPHAALTAGSIVRVEGASVNEYNGKMSLNLNQSTRIVVLKEGTGSVPTSNDPVEISDIPQEGYVCVVGRVLATRPDQIHRKDGSGSIDVVRGRIADSSGTIGFLCWEPFEHPVGTLLKIDGAQVRSFRNTPELNIGRTTRVEIFHDAHFASLQSLNESTALRISEFTDGARDVDAVVQITELVQRSFERDGQQSFLWSGQAIDPTGRCRVSIWDDLPFETSSLPVTISVKGARIRAWQGIPDITIDRADQMSVLKDTPWTEVVDPANHVVVVPLGELANGSSRVGIQTQGVIVSIREDSGFILRCTQCRRVLRDGACFEHGDNAGEEDLRLRLVMDGEGATSAVLVDREGALSLLNMSNQDVKTMVDDIGKLGFVQHVREKVLGRKVIVAGRTIIDDQGAMFIAQSIEKIEEDEQLRASELRSLWGWA